MTVNYPRSRLSNIGTTSLATSRLMRTNSAYESIRTMKSRIVIASCFLTFASAMAESRHSCSIEVADNAGALVRAEVLIHADPPFAPTAPDRILSTSEFGKLAVELPDGFYDVCVLTSSFAPECQKVHVRQGSKPIRFTLHVHPDILPLIADPVR